MKNEQHPNFRDDTGKLFLVRCFECDHDNWSMAVSSGYCAWCGWDETTDDEMLEALREHNEAELS